MRLSNHHAVRRVLNLNGRSVAAVSEVKTNSEGLQTQLALIGFLNIGILVRKKTFSFVSDQRTVLLRAGFYSLRGKILLLSYTMSTQIFFCPNTFSIGYRGPFNVLDEGSEDSICNGPRNRDLSSKKPDNFGGETEGFSLGHKLKRCEEEVRESRRAAPGARSSTSVQKVTLLRKNRRAWNRSISNILRAREIVHISRFCTIERKLLIIQHNYNIILQNLSMSGLLSASIICNFCHQW